MGFFPVPLLLFYASAGAGGLAAPGPVGYLLQQCCEDNKAQSQRCQESILFSDPNDAVTQSFLKSAAPDSISCCRRQPNQRG